jgi:hypothetical protein
VAEGFLVLGSEMQGFGTATESAVPVQMAIEAGASDCQT